jgi:hypothetical protein
MKILVACESSGVVRDAFLALGYDAISCDLLPTENPGPHIQGDVRDVLMEPWDLVIAHPPCTRLCNSGVRWLHERNLWDELREGAQLFFIMLERKLSTGSCRESRDAQTCTGSRRGGVYLHRTAVAVWG